MDGILSVRMTAPASHAPLSADARTLLAEIAGLTEAEWIIVERGGAVAKILDTDTREILISTKSALERED